MTTRYYPFRTDDGDPYGSAEVFYHDHQAALEGQGELRDEHGALRPEGWYWWPCFPGCLPDGPEHGPFVNEEDAIADLGVIPEEADDEDGDYGHLADAPPLSEAAQRWEDHKEAEEYDDRERDAEA